MLLSRTPRHVLLRSSTKITTTYSFSFSTTARTSFRMSQQQQHNTNNNTATGQKPDWSATQYLKFNNERTRPVRDLVAQIPLSNVQRIVDVGCGPGNSTAVLAAAFPDAHIQGMDSSQDMLSKARAAMPNVNFVQGDLRTYEPDPGADLIFGNAVFHWLRTEDRIPTILRLLRTQNPGGVLAFQVPDNYEEPTHRAMRETALLDGPWFAHFQALPADQKPDFDPVETAADYYNALIPFCKEVNIWHTFYQHPLGSPREIVEWVKGSGLQPFLNALPDEGEVRAKYLEAYERRIGELHPRLADGKVLLRYPRLFVVATRK